MPGHFQQTEAREPPGLHPGAVNPQALPQPVFHLPLVSAAGHVDEIDDEQPPQVPQAQLPGDFIGGLQVGVEGRLLDVFALGGLGRVNVYGGQGLRVVDDQHPPGRKLHLPGKGRLYLAFDLVAVEEGVVLRVEIQLGQVVGHDLLHDVPRPVKQLVVVYPDLRDVVAQVVPDRPNDDFAFLVDQERRGFFLGRRLDGGPQHLQVIQIPLQFFGALADAGGADDQAHALGNVQSAHGLPRLGAVAAFDLPGHAAGPGVVRHQHQVASRKADEGGQGRAFVAPFLFFHLDDVFLPHLQFVLDVDAAAAIAALGGFEQGAGYFLEGKEPVPLGAEIDKSRLQTGFNPDHAALVDVRFFLFASFCFNIQVVQTLAINQRHPQLFRLSGVYQHSLHC